MFSQTPFHCLPCSKHSLVKTDRFEKSSLRTVSFFITLLSLSPFCSTLGQSLPERALKSQVNINPGEEPPSLDPTRSVDSVSYFWLGHIYEGLMMKDAAGKLVPGTAASFQLSPDRTVYTFKIRPNAQWHDGKPLTSQDFLFGFRRLVDPKYASEYSFIAQTAGILNAKEVIGGTKPVTELGVSAPDDQTLEVRLQRPTPFFLSLMTFQTFFPIRSDLVQKHGEQFAQSTESVVGNGPYRLHTWKKEQGMKLVKYSPYWNASKIKMEIIECQSLIKDSQASYQAFRTHGLDFIKLDPTNLPIAIKDKQKIKSTSSGRVAYLRLNPAPSSVFHHPMLRQAVRFALNRKEYVTKISGVPGDKAIFGFIPSYFSGSGSKSFRQEFPLSWKDADGQETKKAVEAYLAETKKTEVPPFSILAGDSETAKRESEYFQQMLSKALGTTVKVDSIARKARLQRRRDGQYDISINGWGPDYEDPTTFLDQFLTDAAQKPWEPNDKTFDDLILGSFQKTSEKERLAMISAAEKRLIEEKSIVVPFVEEGSATLAHPKLKGWTRSPFTMDPDLRFAYWETSARM
jgi:oligopeptide transport system substrate-binding protein